MSSINLSFEVESSAGHWNKIFEGFDQDTILTSRFESSSPKSIELLYKLCSFTGKTHKSYSIETRDYGIIIKKAINSKDEKFIKEWINLMKNLRTEIIKLNDKIT